MSSFFQNFNNFAAKRENAIKKVLVEALDENWREIQYDIKQRGVTSLELCECSNSLCTTLEAIFLHGLKNSLLWQTVSAIAGDEERRPDPSFWSPLLVFLHKQVIEQIQSLSQITSETGQCRAWIRLSLNESLFSSYLNNMQKNSSALSSYYYRHALLRDRDVLEMAAKLMEELEAQVEFQMPVNCSLLNQWPDYALQISGVWTPALKSCPLSSGIDVAESINEPTTPSASSPIPTPQPLCTSEFFEKSISNSPFTDASNLASGDLDSGENTDSFLKRMAEMSVIDEEEPGDDKKLTESNGSEIPQPVGVNQAKQIASKRRKTEGDAALRVDVRAAASARSSSPLADSRHGNSLSTLIHNSWSPDANERRDDVFKSGDNSTGSDDKNQLQRSLSRMSFNALLNKHEQSLDFSSTLARSVGQEPGAISGNDGVDDSDRDETSSEPSTLHNRANSDFEIVSLLGVDKFDDAELQEMVEQLCTLSHERGLDVQGFVCKSCTHPLIVGFSNFQVCGFNGSYYCDSCMDSEPVLIPAKIIFNGDFGKYLVSKRASLFLAEFRNYPLLDMKLLNPRIYKASESMAELQCVRIRLNFVRAYMCTCSPETAEQLRCMCYGMEYLYESIHQYSIANLANINRNTLLNQLTKLYKLGEKHVLKCAKCRVKGFICEICGSQRVLYPFHIDTTYRCETCGSVFHPECLSAHQPCPRCERRRKRECLADALDADEM